MEVVVVEVDVVVVMVGVGAVVVVVGSPATCVAIGAVVVSGDPADAAFEEVPPPPAAGIGPAPPLALPPPASEYDMAGGGRFGGNGVGADVVGADALGPGAVEPVRFTKLTSSSATTASILASRFVTTVDSDAVTPGAGTALRRPAPAAAACDADGEEGRAIMPSMSPMPTSSAEVRTAAAWPCRWRRPRRAQFLETIVHPHRSMRPAGARCNTG
ncbi:MAG: hypothetical protein M0Z95_12355 [Actinomycetota bacterium]|nr:hypothetical protein [Actinomycetota bacterium]